MPTTTKTGPVRRRPHRPPNRPAQAPGSHSKWTKSRGLDNPESGDYNLRAREYDPTLARFLSTDPLASSLDTQASYLYARNDPLTYSDPTGQSGFCLFGHRADGSCNLAGSPTDTLHAVEGVGHGIYNTGRDIVDTAIHPIRTIQNLSSACEQGLNGSSNTLDGILRCIDDINPAADIRRTYQRAYQLAEQGCIQQAAAAFTQAAIATAALVAPLAGAAVVGDAADAADAADPAGGVEVDAAAGVSALRQAYVDDVTSLRDRAASMRAEGASSEEIARALWADRRALGVKYKNITPPDELARIYARNQLKYGDPLGPSIDWLRARGRSWEDIIESAARPGGQDLGY